MIDALLESFAWMPPGAGHLPEHLPDVLSAVTARSYFQGMVNVLMMDGSVRAINDEIHPGVWRGISTRAGSEVLPDDFNK